MREEPIPFRTPPGRRSVEYERRPKPWAGEARIDPCASVARGAVIGYFRYFVAVSQDESWRGTIAARQAAAAERRMDANIIRAVVLAPRGGEVSGGRKGSEVEAPRQARNRPFYIYHPIFLRLCCLQRCFKAWRVAGLRQSANCKDFIAEVAEHATSKVDSLDHDSESDEAAKTRASYARQLRLRWLRLISLTRVRTIAERLCGTSASAAKAAAAATQHQVQIWLSP